MDSKADLFHQPEIPSRSPTKSPRTLTIVAIGVTILVTVVAGYFLGIRRNLSSDRTSRIADHPSPAPTAADNQANLTYGWHTFTNAEYGYSLRYPEGLVLLEATPYSVLLNPLEQRVGYPTFYIAVVPDGFWQNGAVYNYSTPDLLNILSSIHVGDEKPVLPDQSEWNTFKRLPDVTVSGEVGMVYENSHIDRLGTRDRRILLKKKRRTYMIGGYWRFPEELKTFNKILSTFSFKSSSN